MTALLPALKAGAAALLAARGEGVLASILETAEIEIAGAGQTWAMGSRTVTAHRVALIVDAPAFVRLSADPANHEALRSAFALAMRSPETELADLSILLRLKALGRPWQSVYRGAPARCTPERPDEEAVLGGAIALCEAAGDDAAADVLRRADLELADVPGSAEGPLLHAVVRLDPVDFARADRDPALAGRIRHAVHSAGTRAVEPMASVDLAVRIRSPERSGEGPEQLLTRALQSSGIAVLPVSRRSELVTLAMAVDGELRQIDLVDDAAQDITTTATSIVCYTIAARTIGDPAGAHAVSAMLSGDDPG